MKRHKCLTDIDKELKKHNTRLVCNLFNDNQLLIDTETVEKKRGARPKLVIASHCPFCGKKLASEKGTV